MKKYRIKKDSYLWHLMNAVKGPWLFIVFGITIIVAFAFADKPAEGSEIQPTGCTEQIAIEKLYDVPLEAELQLHIENLCKVYDVDMPLVLAIIGQESNYNPAAIGDNGHSFGLMQIQPQHHQNRMDKLGVTDLLDPYQNVIVGIDILSELLSKNNTEWAVTAYNAGAKKADFNLNIGTRSEYAESVLLLCESLKA